MPFLVLTEADALTWEHQFVDMLSETGKFDGMCATGEFLQVSAIFV